MKTTNMPKSLLEEKLLEAHQIIDDLVLQLALGKAEAADKFDELKKEFTSKLSQWKNEFKSNSFISVWNAILEEPSPANELTLEEKIDKIFSTLSSFEKEMKKDHHTHNNYIFYDLEVFKLKLEILRLRLQVKKFDVTKNFQSKMKSAKQLISKVSHNISNEFESGREKLEQISDDANEIFRHLKKAISSLG